MKVNPPIRNILLLCILLLGLGAMLFSFDFWVA